ncbi:MAG: DUF4321 domain-containing protein [Candidatus Latescibacteria bacterium]|nr:DUF4321 domain-containing protein [Candidatus Latescibacterota bacterium]
MLKNKSASHLILILFTSVIGSNIIGEALRVVLHFLVGEGNIVERSLLTYREYELGPHFFNLIILSFSFALTLKFNVITLLGIFVGWYYFKYSY